jgi:hypothetical protein
MWICGRCGERNQEPATSCSICAGVLAGQSDPLSCESCGSPVSAGVRRCEACERAMADAPPRGRLTRVWSCSNPSEAELLRVELRRAGIESVLENVGGAALGMGTAVVPFGIIVADEHARRALEVIQAERSRLPAEVYVPPVAMIRFPCGCGKELEVPPDFKGLEMDCPYCGRSVRAG